MSQQSICLALSNRHPLAAPSTNTLGRLHSLFAEHFALHHVRRRVAPPVSHARRGDYGLVGPALGPAQDALPVPIHTDLADRGRDRVGTDRFADDLRCCNKLRRRFRSVTAGRCRNAIIGRYTRSQCDVLCCLSSTLSLWLPVTASDAPFSFLETVRLGRGNSWRLMVIVFGAEIGPTVVLIILGMLTHAIPQGSATIDLIIGLARNALAYAVLAAGITALSVAYDRLLARVANDPLYTQDGMPFMDE